MHSPHTLCFSQQSHQDAPWSQSHVQLSEKLSGGPAVNLLHKGALRQFCPLKWPQEAARLGQDGGGGGVLSGQESDKRSKTRGLAGACALAGPVWLSATGEEESLMKRVLVTCHTSHDGWEGRPGLGGYSSICLPESISIRERDLHRV